MEIPQFLGDFFPVALDFPVRVKPGKVYIDIGVIAADKDGQPPASYGTLLRPTEEGRVGDRVARSARFMGSYQEFKAHCRDLPGLVKAHVALWADAPGQSSTKA